MAETFTVGALSARTGVSRQALRVYEAARILTPMARTPSGYRVYGHEAVKVDGMLRDLKAMRRRLGALVAARRRRTGGVVCPHIEAFTTMRRKGHGKEDVALPVVHALSRGRSGRRRSADR